MSIGIGQLIEVGEALCEACVELYDPPVASVSMFDIPTEWDPDLENTSKNNLIRFAEVRYTSKVSLPLLFALIPALNLRQNYPWID